MAQLIFFLALGLTQITFASGPRAEILKTWTLPADFKASGKKVGGLSGCSLYENKIYLVSDDKRHDGARVISFPYDFSTNEINLKDAQVLKIKKPSADQKILDLEGLGFSSFSRILLSSEGDLNQKPRIMPTLFWVNQLGAKVSSIQFPKEYLPEKSGKQTQGIQNNLGFEGLVVDLDLKRWAAILEAPLLQSAGNLRLVESQLDSKVFDSVFNYPVPQDMNLETLSGYFGATDLLFLDSANFLVLERGVEASLQGIVYRTQLCLASKSKNALERNCFYSMNADSKFSSQFASGANFEGLCWVNKQKKLFIAVSDNNFSKNEKSVFILYQLH